jgi:hypothetical protein
MEKYLGHQRTTELGPPDKDGSGWLLVPKLETKKSTVFDRQNEDELEDYVLVRPRAHVKIKDPQDNRGRGAKLFNLRSGNSRDYMALVLTKAYKFVQMYDIRVEFHIKYGRTELGYNSMARRPGGLALRPELIAKSMGGFLHVEPLTDGYNVVFVIGKSEEKEAKTQMRMKYWNGKLDSCFKYLHNLEAVGNATLAVEKQRDSAEVVLQEDAEIERLEEEGQSYDHILQQQEKLEERRADIREYFSKKALEREIDKRLKVDTKKRVMRQKREEELLKRRLWKQNKERQASEQKAWKQLAEPKRLVRTYISAEPEHQVTTADRSSRMESITYPTARIEYQGMNTDRSSQLDRSTRHASKQESWEQLAEPDEVGESYLTTGTEHQVTTADRFSETDSRIYPTARIDYPEMKADRFSQMDSSTHPTTRTEHKEMNSDRFSQMDSRVYPTARIDYQGMKSDRLSQIDSGIRHARVAEASRSNEGSVKDYTVLFRPRIRYQMAGHLVRKIELPELDMSPSRLRTVGTGDWDSPDERPVTVRRVMDTEYPPVHESVSEESAKSSPRIDPATGLDKRSLLYHYSGDSALRRVQNPEKSYWNRAQRQGSRSIF